MKLGLLTFHTAANYGAALQAYAFEKFLVDKGYNCEYINYVNASRAHEYSMSWHIFDSLRKGNVKFAMAYTLGAPFMTLRKMRFDRFYEKYIKKTKKVYRTSEEAAQLNECYDYFLVGSDQVWNPVCNGDDTAFLLDFVKEGKKKISYSPSFGMASVPDDLKENYRRNLSNFGSLGVREQAGKTIVRELIGKDAAVNIDPVMLLTKEQWLGILPRKVSRERFIFSYTNRDSQIADFFRTGYKLDGRKHYVLSRYTRPRDFISPTVRVKYCMSPLEFIWVIANAELVVSASFHCVAMSILLNRPFVAILTGDEGKDERIVNLLKTTGLTSRVLSKETGQDVINAAIDWDDVNNKIAEARKTSVSFLLNAISK